MHRVIDAHIICSSSGNLRRPARSSSVSFAHGPVHCRCIQVDAELVALTVARIALATKCTASSCSSPSHWQMLIDIDLEGCACRHNVSSRDPLFDQTSIAEHHSACTFSSISFSLLFSTPINIVCSRNVISGTASASSDLEAHSRGSVGFDEQGSRES